MICAAELKEKNGDSRVALRDGVKCSGLDWSDENSRGKNVLGIPGRKRGVSFTDAAGHLADVKSMGINVTYAELKNSAGTKGYAARMGDSEVSRRYSSKSPQRKQATAEIAKIPYPLAQWIAEIFKPKHKI
jgi:hypothetical protein